MDSYSEHPSDFDLPSSSEALPPNDVSAAIGTDERRMHVRAYNYWVSLLDGRDFPSIEDLEPGAVQDFAGNSVLLDFTCGRDNPAIPYIGPAIRDECGLDDDARTIADVPSRSLLSRLTGHYMQIIANRAPIGFEAEFLNQREENICYRGILMPFSSDGDTIDFIYGVINWKNVDGHSAAEPAPEAVDDSAIEEHAATFEEPVAIEPGPELEEDVEEPLEVDQPLGIEEGFAEAPLELDEPVAVPEPKAAAEGAVVPGTWQDETIDEQEASGATAAEPEGPRADFAWDVEPTEDEVSALPVVALDESAGLADRLWAARETAESVKAGEGRTRAALYRALSLAYDFAIAARENLEEYAELLEESGVKAQERAPMTPIVKLVFGIDYDKARLTEFAAALSYAQRQEVAQGGFQDLIEKQAGGLKALVAAERQARRPEPKPDTKGELARARLRTAPSISLAELPADAEFAVVITRRGPDGTHEPVAIVDDEALVERTIRSAA
ncbi:MAG TPA: hypothetical protein VIV07_05135 [Sphingomicrobium sp.]